MPPLPSQDERMTNVVNYIQEDTHNWMQPISMDNFGPNQSLAVSYDPTTAMYPPGTRLGQDCSNPSLKDVDGLRALKATIVNDTAANMARLAEWDVLDQGLAPCDQELCVPCDDLFTEWCRPCALPYLGCQMYRVFYISLGKLANRLPCFEIWLYGETEKEYGLNAFHPLQVNMFMVCPFCQ